MTDSLNADTVGHHPEVQPMAQGEHPNCVVCGEVWPCSTVRTASNADSEGREATDIWCQRCGRNLRDHGAYLDNVPPDAIEGEFPLGIRGLYCQPPTADTVGRYDRRVLVDVLVHHWPTHTSGCGCGWAKLGHSHPEHVADEYEVSLALNDSLRADADK